MEKDPSSILTLSDEISSEIIIRVSAENKEPLISTEDKLEDVNISNIIKTNGTVTYEGVNYTITCNKETKKEYNLNTIILIETKHFTELKSSLDRTYILVFDSNYYANIPSDFKNYSKIQQLIYLLITNKVKYSFKKKDRVLKLNIKYRIHNKLNTIDFYLIEKEIYDMFKTYTELSSSLLKEPDNLIKQNSFEDVRIKIKRLGDLGHYSYLKEILNDKISLSLQPIEEKGSCCCC